MERTVGKLKARRFRFYPDGKGEPLESSPLEIVWRADWRGPTILQVRFRRAYSWTVVAGVKTPASHTRVQAATLTPNSGFLLKHTRGSGTAGSSACVPDNHLESWMKFPAPAGALPLK